MKRIFCVLETCLGCKTCEIACAVEHSESKELFSALKEKPLPKQRVLVENSKTGPYPLICRHCDEPLCMLVCISSAIKKDPQTGLVLIDKEKCVGCGMCIMNCPFSALVMDKDRKVSLKCDLCIEKGEPSCLKACPTKSLFFGTLEEFEKYKESKKEKIKK